MYKISQYTMVCRVDGQPYAVNTYTGAIGRVDEALACALQSRTLDESAQSPEALEALKANGYLVPAALDEYQRILNAEAAALVIPREGMSLVIAPTLGCNYKCKYCFEAGVVHRAMSAETEEQVVQFFLQCSQPPVKTIKVNWFGGEPLLALDTIRRLSARFIQHCEQQRVKYFSTMISNGYYLTAEVARELAENCALRHVQITLDGPEAIYEENKGCAPGSYRRVIENIKAASQHLDITLRLNIAPQDYGLLSSYRKELQQEFAGCKSVRLYLAEVREDWGPQMTVVPQSSAYYKVKLQFDRELDQAWPGARGNLRPLRFDGPICGLIRKQNAVIGPKGELYRCEHLLGRTEEVIGSCAEGLYHNAADQKFSSVGHLERCRTCPIMPLCMTECPHDTLQGAAERIDCESKILSVQDAFAAKIRAEQLKQVEPRINAGDEIQFE
ncbi:MAG: radical SAM protein [Faecalibacterium sp.]|nr:radical SAM protein [Faecalibacterium sp.]